MRLLRAIGAGVVLLAWGGVAAARAGTEEDSARAWTLEPDLRVTAALGGDSNPLRLDSDLAGNDGVYALDGVFLGELVFRLTGRSGTDGKDVFHFLDVGVGVAGARRWQHGLRDFEPVETTWRARVDGDVWWNRKALPRQQQKGLQRVSLGLLVEDSFATPPSRDVAAVVPAIQLVWRTSGVCDLTSTVLYGRIASTDDREAVRGSPFDRDGRTRVIGIEQTLLAAGGEPRCDRAGPFRRIVPERRWSGYFGVGRQWQSPDGTEFASRDVAAYAGGQAPLWGRKERWSIEGALDLRRSDFTHPSRFPPGERREDRSLHLEAALRRHMRHRIPEWLPVRHFDLLLGAGVDRVDSNIPVFDHDRWWAFAGIDVGFRKTEGLSSTEGGAARLGRRSSGAGSSGAIVPTQIP